MNHLETYLTDLRDTRATGEAVKETSFYPALSTMLNAYGGELKPKVRCVINIKNRGAGIPDGGLFSGEQLRGNDAEQITNSANFGGQIPGRGVLEVKGAGDDVDKIAGSVQVKKYLDRYGLVLVTNLREFVVTVRDANGAARLLEGYALAADEKEFWARIKNPREFAREHESRFDEYIKRVMLMSAPLDAPESLAWFLASYARDAKARIEQAELPQLATVRTALEDALGLRFEGEKGEAFFRSTLIQTLFYGVFSAWVLWCKTAEGRNRENRFDWRLAQWTLHVPVIRTLFELVVTPSNVRGLGLEEVLAWTSDALSRVERVKFFERFEEEHAVQYFYEPFLEAFDPELRKSLGVWYTPQEIVAYMVERVDRTLREELDIELGLADERVYVLDPCCGTGAYLVEVLKRIKRTLDAGGGDALTGDDLKRAAMERLFGFEILPAPFVVAHLQLGLQLQQAGAALKGGTNGERVGVYLTNALTGWSPPTEPKTKLLFAELEQERDAAESIKQRKPILVVLGNPPYNAFAGTSATEEGGLVEAYKEGLSKDWGIKKFNLDDLYVRFFRLAERRIAEQTGKGIVCFISNFSYLSDPSFVVMRQRFLSEFDKLWFDSLNGDSRETGKLTPEGKPDPSVFSTAYNREGIRVGTAIGLMVRRGERGTKAEVRTRQFWGVTKREQLTESLAARDVNGGYETAKPDASNRFSFRPSEVSSEYLSWAKLTDLCAVAPSNGLMEKRGGALIGIDRDALEARMKMYFDEGVSWSELEELKTGLTEDAARFDAMKAHDKVLKAEGYKENHLRRYALRPFDSRWCYYSPTRPLWNEPRPTLWAQCWEGNSFLMSRPAGAADPEGAPISFARILGDNDYQRGHSYYFPLRIRSTVTRKNAAQESLLDAPQETITANLSPFAREYLNTLGIPDPDASPTDAALIWMHSLAVGYTPAYLEDNRDGIRSDFPRIPLPHKLETLRASAALGKQVAALLDTETEVAGVTSGTLSPTLACIGVLKSATGNALNPSNGDLKSRAGWGHKGKGGITMPGKGRTLTRRNTEAEFAAYETLAPDNRVDVFRDNQNQWRDNQTYDIYLNDTAFWSNVPVPVWEYTIGGYQVIKKWLSYREYENLGRSLTVTEAREVTRMIRRIGALLLLEDELTANYLQCKAKPPQASPPPKRYKIR